VTASGDPVGWETERCRMAQATAPILDSTVHLIPTSSSWLNQVECFFALLTEKKIRRGIYRSVAALRADITSFIDRHNADPKPFRWTKSADDILASIERFRRYNAPAKHHAMLRTSGSGH
jgi:hypothetical protein